jgi:hypothetical protein
MKAIDVWIKFFWVVMLWGLKEEHTSPFSRYPKDGSNVFLQ